MLTQPQMTVHEEFKFSCRQCDHQAQAVTKEKRTHQRGVHEGVKCPRL